MGDLKAPAAVDPELFTIGIDRCWAQCLWLSVKVFSARNCSRRMALSEKQMNRAYAMMKTTLISILGPKMGELRSDQLATHRQIIPLIAQNKVGADDVIRNRKLVWRMIDCHLDHQWLE